jgi:putative Ca2+/H+ antiporter (TMEM165/GDT1 family)
VFSAFFTPFVVPFAAPFLSAFLLAAVSEFGDKTQLLAASLNLRFRKPWEILGAATLASIANHLAVAILGRWIGFHFDQKIVAHLVTGLRVLLAAITLFGAGARAKDSSQNVKDTNTGGEPDDNAKGQRHLHSQPPQHRHQAYSFLGVFFILLLAEMGDKTQFITGALAAKYNSTFAVTIGSSLGTILPDAAAIFVMQRLGSAIHWKHLRYLSAGTFLASAAFVGIKL